MKSKLNSSSTVIVDSRKPEDYNAGKIGNAVNIPFEELVTEEKTYKDKAALKALFEKAGVTPDKEIILYCKTGLRAGGTFFVLDGILEYPNVKVYDGSWNDWSK